MSTQSSIILEKVKSFPLSFGLVSLALIAGLILSVLSWLEICVEHCSANQEYHLFGLPFAFVGISFFVVLNALHLLSWRYQSLSTLVGWMIAAALGSELMFIAIQKYQIGHWCPVCLSIAASVAVAALVLVTGYLSRLKATIQHHNRGEVMKQIKQSFSYLSFVIVGFLMAFVGVSKVDTVEAAINDIKERIVFGEKNSPVEVYFVSDWFCPSCKKIEIEMEKIYPKIKNKVAFYFIDFPIHKKSLNFSPYNLAFLVNDKPNYFKARQMLLALTEETQSPKDKDIEKAAKKNGLTFKELSYLDIKTGLEYFDKIVDKYDLHATPTIIITNPKRNSVVKLEGRDEISEEKILNAIEKMTPPK
jgi:protein-disulfide isomerase